MGNITQRFSNVEAQTYRAYLSRTECIKGRYHSKCPGIVHQIKLRDSSAFSFSSLESMCGDKKEFNAERQELAESSESPHCPSGSAKHFLVERT